jgi:hypothetical protein
VRGSASNGGVMTPSYHYHGFLQAGHRSRILAPISHLLQQRYTHRYLHQYRSALSSAGECAPQDPQ